MAELTKPYVMDLRIVVSPFGVRSYRAAAKLGGKTFVGAGKDEPSEAVRILLAQLSGQAGSWGDEPLLALELQLMGGEEMLKLLNGPEAE